MRDETLIAYYGKFNEEKRLNSRHGQVEFITTMKVVHEYLEKFENPKILELGAGTGRYSVTLANEGYDVSAVELVKSNLGTLKAKKSTVKAYLGNAMDLHRFKDEEFDVILIFGPMYHLFTDEDKVKVFTESKRVLSKNGYILVAYCMNEYAIITHGFKEKSLFEKDDTIDEDFHVNSDLVNLFDFVRIEDIDRINEKAQVNRVEIVAADGPANYMRPLLKQMNEQEFEMFMKYHLATYKRMDCIGASTHTIDVLKKVG